jgi:carbon monoxide dehydrogenase subunit G
MAIEIVKTFVVKAPPAAVWGFLTDPQRVARCMPGAAITDRIDDKTYSGTMAVKVGPVSTSYKGKIVFERLDEGARTAEIVATGQDVRGRGGADLRLTSSIKEVAPGETEVTAASKVNITGILAQMGRGMVQDVSDQLFQTFSQRMRAELEPAAPAVASAGTAAPSPSAPAIGAVFPSSPPVRAEALDLGSLGAKVAGRAAGRVVRRPAFWIAVIAVAGLLYLLFR